MYVPRRRSSRASGRANSERGAWGSTVALTGVPARGHDSGMNRPLLVLGVALVGCTGAADPVAPVLQLDATAVDAPPPVDAYQHALDASEGGLGIALTIPVGVYTECTATVDSVVHGLNETGGGGMGTVTLATDGDGGISVALTFQPCVSGTAAFAPTSTTTAGSTAGSLDIGSSCSSTVSLTVPLAARSC